MPGLLGKKLGMTQIFSSDGEWVPVTVVQAGPCQVVEVRTPEKNGYVAVQLGFEETEEKKFNKSKLGYFKKKKSKPYRYLKEIRTSEGGLYQSGDLLGVSLFKEGDTVDLVGVSKGKGFQGVMKRHHFSGGHATHGNSLSHRAPGSIGQRAEPGKVMKGQKMAGQMGSEVVTTKNLKVVSVEADQNIILIKGSIPGSPTGLVTIHPTTKDFEKRIAESKK